MNLETLLEGLEYQVICGTPDKDITSIAYHSDKAAPGGVFFAIEGSEDDGRKYINKALENGASVIVTDDMVAARAVPCTAVHVADVRQALAAASANFFRRPACGLLTIGVTGTKGKTTTAFMIREIFEKAGIKTGIIGTVVNGCSDFFEEAEGTTPQSFEIHRLMSRMAGCGCKAVVMEVSSQGMMQQRTWGTEFDAAVFTNISPDHIGSGEHKSFEEYLYWKTMLFNWAKVAIINIDDAHWKTFAGAAERARSTATFGTCEGADYMAENIVLRRCGNMLDTEFTLQGRQISLGLPGKFNVFNALGAAAVARQFGIDWDVIEAALRDIKVRGRAEHVPFSDDFSVIVDYAHNGIALKNLLETLREYKPARLTVVFGCGGNRDRDRRVEMAEAASSFADFSVITSDNPRNEEPLKIIEDITGAMDRLGGYYTVIPDRKQAIEWAVSYGQTGDIIVIAGKGHETYQIIGNVKKHFDDREIVLSAKDDNRG